MTKRKQIDFIKICGITDIKTALACKKFGANSIGFVFYEKSPRHISDEKAFKISQALCETIIITGVFVDRDFDFIMDKVEKFSLKAVQLHGNESSQLVTRLQAKHIIVIKTVFLKRKPFLKDADQYKNASYLLVECPNNILTNLYGIEMTYMVASEGIHSKFMTVSVTSLLNNNCLELQPNNFCPHFHLHRIYCQIIQLISTGTKKIDNESRSSSKSY